MLLSHLWPSFPDDRILYEDRAVIVIDKPVNVPTHGADAARNDDALSRLRLALAERDHQPEERVYLGTHQRLDRDTSGVLLFSRAKEANASLAAQFEGRLVKKTYVAVVTGWPRTPEQGTLAHDLAPAEGGRMQAVNPAARGRQRGGRDVQHAVTRYRVLRREGTRTLLELSPETGRTHQIRVQVSAMGGAVAGDRLYGGEPAPRLMLHAARLALRHPTSGAPLEVRSPLPPELEQWLADPRALVGADDARFEGRLRAAAEQRFSLGRSGDTTAFRLVHGEGDGLEGIAIDLYGEHLVLHLLSDAAIAQRERIADHAFALGPRGVYLKVHPKQANTLVDARASELAPSHPVRGEPASEPLWVLEQGLQFRVTLGDGLKTGIFLDQRDNRRRVRELSPGKRVLNLFAYTCGFSVAAAAGGARETMSVDASGAALEWGAENLARNQLDAHSNLLADADVFEWLKLASKRGERYDLVVLDPPSYATTKSSRFSAESDLPDLGGRALSVLAPGGRMLACTNHRRISLPRFRKAMHEAVRHADRRLVQMKDLPPPGDFPPMQGADPHLKTVLITVE